MERYGVMTPELLKLLKSCENKNLDNLKVNFEEIQKVYRAVILKFMQPSPLRHSPWLSNLTGGNIWLKLEQLEEFV